MSQRNTAQIIVLVKNMNLRKNDIFYLTSNHRDIMFSSYGGLSENTTYSLLIMIDHYYTNGQP